MDANLIHSIFTVLAFAAFLGIVAWAYSPSRKSELEALGRSLLEESDQ